MKIRKGFYDVWVIKSDEISSCRAVAKLKEEGFKHNQITAEHIWGEWVVTGKRKLNIRRHPKLI